MLFPIFFIKHFKIKQLGDNIMPSSLTQRLEYAENNIKDLSKLGFSLVQQARRLSGADSPMDALDKVHKIDSLIAQMKEARACTRTLNEVNNILSGLEEEYKDYHFKEEESWKLLSANLLALLGTE